MKNLNIKSVNEILTSMIEFTVHSTSKLTNFSIGSTIRTLYEAVALQIEEFYFAMKSNFKKFVKSAVLTSFGFEYADATYASGELIMTFKAELTSPLFIKEKTKFCTVPGITEIKYYESTKAIVVPKGAISVTIPVQATAQGLLGNTSENTITNMVLANNLVANVTNLKPFINGTEAETVVQCQKRFQTYVKNLARGTTEALYYASSQVEGIYAVWIDDTKAGYVTVYAQDVTGGLPDYLAKSLLDKLNEYRAAGVQVIVTKVVQTPVNFVIKVYVKPGFSETTYKTIVKSGLNSFMEALKLGDDLNYSDLVNKLSNMDTTAISSVVMTSPSDNVIARNFERLILGSSDITVIVNAVE